MPNDAPLLSVIIPVYNSEAFLPQCLASVVRQTCQNIEIIVVNDGSLGNCKEICALYPRVIYTGYGKNRGSFHAREHGTRLAKGHYIMFLDADDWLHPNICASIADAGDGDVILSETMSIYKWHRERAPWPNRGLKKVQGDNLLPLLFDRSFSSWATAGKVFQRELALEVYKELAVDQHLTMAEDFLFFTAYTYYVRRAKVLKSVGYCYNLTGESVNRTELSLKKLEKHWQDLAFVVETFRRFFADKPVPSLKPLEEALLYTFLARFADSPSGAELLAPFIVRIGETFGYGALAPYVTDGVRSRKNYFLRALHPLSKGFSAVGRPLLRVLRAGAGIFYSLVKRY